MSMGLHTIPLKIMFMLVMLIMNLLVVVDLRFVSMFV
jgi:hypothetical protein